MDFNSSGAMRSPFSPRMRPSITGRRAIGSSAKKGQSKYFQEEQAGDVIYKSPMLTVETYGAPLPVMVTEALTFGNGDVSVKLSSCGWCWVVTGRRILAWERDEAGAAARELTLPQTDLAHKADLVEMFYEDGSQIPSCVGVSPEGIVRYWPSVGQEGVYVDVSCELAGQECDRVCAPAAVPAPATAPTLVLATTTCTLVLLSPAEKDGRATVTCKTLRPPSGWLGGIGRRVSLLFFGSMTGHADTRLVGVVWWGAESVALVGDGGAGPLLQLWSPRGSLQHALRPLLAAHLAHGDPNSLEIQALDVHASDDEGLLLLIAIVNVARSPEVRYAIAHISLEDPNEPAVGCVSVVRGGAGGDGAPPRLLAVGVRHAVLYTRTHLAGVTLATAAGADAADAALDVPAGDRLLAAAVCAGAPLAFLARHGVVRVRGAAPTADASPAPAAPPAPAADSELALLALDPRELAATATDARTRLQTAFLFHLRRDAAAARALLPPPAQNDQYDDVDAPLDRSVLAVAVDMLDDMPAGDPRWKSRAGGSSISLGSSSALQILPQLQDKKRAFTLFLDFLRAVGLWQQMQNVTFEGSVVSTRAALATLAERLAAALALRALHHRQDQPLLDALIHQAVQEEPEYRAECGGALPPADVWYRRVTRAHTALPALAARADSPAAALHALALLHHVLAEMQACRAQWAGADAASPAPPAPHWLHPLLEFLRRVLLENVREAATESVRSQLCEGAARLADLLLSAGLQLSDALYEDFRRAAISPFREVGQRERAAVLAEKFGDFDLLIEMCLDDDDWDRLRVYMEKYGDEGFPERAFAASADRGRRAARRLLALRGAMGARLERWLRGGGAARASLLAARLLAAGDRGAAARALAALAAAEREVAGRARAAAALAKLCAVAGGEAEARRAADAALALEEHRAALPAALRRRAGEAPLRPAALARLYAEAGRDTPLTEYDYKKALDLTLYVPDAEERDALRLQIWRAALRRDRWDAAADAADASEAETEALLRDTVLVRLADLLHHMGEDVSAWAPPLEALEGEAGAQYLLRRAHRMLLLH